jgi:putative heme-binding domain-containing protein
VAAFLFDHWNSLGPAPLREAVTILTSNTPSAMRLMEKMKSGEINKALMPPMQRWSYCRSGDEKLKTLAVELFGTPDSDRAKVITTYKQALPALKGDLARGRAVFEKAACATCHLIGELGTQVGPDLADVHIKHPEALLTDILDPNRMIEERWIAYTITTKDQRTIAGLITGESDAQVTLSLPGGTRETIARDQIAELRSTAQSLMPVGLESAISPQAMADLIAFLNAR